MTIATSKTLNLAGFLVGVAGAGKSSHVQELANDFADRGGYVFFHDPTRSFEELGAVFFASWAEYLATAAKDLDEAGLPKLRVASFGCPWSELVAGMKELGRTYNTQNHVRMPMLLVGDEASGIDSSGRTHMSQEDQELWAQRRHFGIAILVNLQRVKNLPTPFWEQVNHIWVFRVTPGDVAIITDGADLPRNLIADGPQLEQFAFLHVELGFEKRIAEGRLWEVPS
jgi:hypothetical protein